jgi:rhodanese-related sulfurtransferase
MNNIMIKTTPLILLFLIFFTGSVYAEKLTNLSAEQLLDLQSKNALVIDIRTEQEWNKTGIIPDSHKLQFFNANGKFDLDSWLSDLEKLKQSPDQAIVLVCRSGNRTGQVGQLLSQKLGMKNIFHLSSGISQWIKSKHQVTKTCSLQSSC